MTNLQYRIKKIDIFLADFKSRFGFYIQKCQKNTTSKNGIIGPLSLILSDLWPIYWFWDFVTHILGNEFFYVFFMPDFR